MKKGKKVPVKIVTQNSASNRSPAVSVDLNAEEVRILIHFSDGSIKEIFNGKEFSEDKFMKKAKEQSLIPSR